MAQSPGGPRPSRASSLQSARPLTARAGALASSWLASVGSLALFAARAARDLFRPPLEAGEILRHLFELGARSAPLIAVSGLAVGVVLSMHTRATLERFGAESMIPAGLAMALIRETGPLTAGLLLAGRIGAGIGAELGAMRVTEQIDALEASGVDSFRYLVVTRVIACLIAFPLLTTILNFAGIFGGFLAETLVSGMSLQLYMQRAFLMIDFATFVPSTLKTMVFGFIIATVSSWLGFNTTQGTEGVGRASTQSVVLSSILLIVVNVLLVQTIFVLFPSIR